MEMLYEVVPALRGKVVILASASARRRRLAAQIGLQCSVVASGFAEDLDKSAFSSAQAYVMENARRKAADVLPTQRAAQPTADLLVIGCDTVVALDGQILEKPADAVAAVHMLKRLSGRKHSVYTGVALLHLPRAAELQSDVFVEETDVTFGTLSDGLIDAYVATGEPLDKAGGYGVQELGALLVKRIEGDYFNVVGLPIYRLVEKLTALLQ